MATNSKKVEELRTKLNAANNQLEMTTKQLATMRNINARMRDEFAEKEKRIRCQVVDEVQSRFQRLDNIQSEQYRQSMAKFEDLAEERIRIWVDGTKRRYEEQIDKLKSTYDTRIAALEKALLQTDCVHGGGIESQHAKDRIEIERLRQELAKKSKDIEDYKELLMEASEKFQQQQNTIIELEERSAILQETVHQMEEERSMLTTV